MTNEARKQSVNLDVLSDGCVAWRYLDGAPETNEHAHGIGAAESDEDILVQGNIAVEEENDDVSGILQIDGNYTSRAGSMLSLDWDNYASDPSFISPSSSLPMIQDVSERSQRRSARARSNSTRDSVKDEGHGYCFRPRKLSFFDVDDLELSSESSASDVFDLHHGDLQGRARVRNQENLVPSLPDVDVPPALPPRAQRSQSVLVIARRQDLGHRS